MVVWVFAGGGEAEVRGLIPFLEQNFPGCKFERKTPVLQKPGPKPGKVSGYGKTGKSLIRHERMRWWLSTQRNIPFDNPESFSEYDPTRDCCQEKLSEALIESSILKESEARFSKGSHTPLLLLAIRCDEVQKKCPLFREMYNYLMY
ncbi:hypothetical protein MEO94_29330 [Dolichospermum sp. ST_sed9]|nr:hypothetical protein [Dolichospermum sp. ST_sed9]